MDLVDFQLVELCQFVPPPNHTPCLPLQARTTFPADPAFENTTIKWQAYTFSEGGGCVSQCATGFYGDLTTGVCTAVRVCGVSTFTQFNLLISASIFKELILCPP